jgi:predicted HAD superfamily phosphohydrolase YqeG
MAEKNNTVAYVDVDDTLVRWASTKRIPIPRTIERIRALHSEGATVYLWSTGGAEYARSIAADLGIAHCFIGFLSKPTLIVDDQAIHEWRDLKHEYPIGS